MWLCRGYKKKKSKETMLQQRKLDCPICNHPRLTNSSDHLIHSHNISGTERKILFWKARFSVLSRELEQPHPSIPQSDSTHRQCEYTVLETSSLPEQRKLPNPLPPNSTSDKNEDELIPSPYDYCIDYERVWGSNVLVMDYDIFKLHHPFTVLEAGPRGA